MKGVIFDLDQTLLDTSCAAQDRRNRNWPAVYNHIPNFNKYEQIQEAIDWIRSQGIKVCIVTKSPSTYCRKVLAHWNIQVDHMVCYHDVNNQKPHPEPMLKALAVMGLSNDEVISFGDEASDIVSSRGANIRSVACLWGASDHSALKTSNPDHTISHPSEIIETVQSVRGDA